jgi:hypothetical protein
VYVFQFYVVSADFFPIVVIIVSGVVSVFAWKSLDAKSGTPSANASKATSTTAAAAAVSSANHGVNGTGSGHGNGAASGHGAYVVNVKPNVEQPLLTIK